MENRNENEVCVPDDDIDTIEERQHFQRIVAAFKFYKLHSQRRLIKTLKYMSSLPESHQRVLHNYKVHLSKIKQLIERNYEIIKLIILDVAHMFENADHTDDVDSNVVLISQNGRCHPTFSKHTAEITATLADMDKVQALFKQFVREWSTEGEEERKECFQPILDEISERFPRNLVDPREIRIVVPGAGLGRLAFEIARKGYTCQGNEYSLFMLFASNFILNRCKGVNLYEVYPWIHQLTNHVSSADQIRSAKFPDADPSGLPPDSEFSMAAGNFIEVYKVPESWHCVATCFFIDTANNIVSYIETIWNILKPGGYWINIGPLLYHFADLPSEDSIEPSYEEVKRIINHFGFIYLKEELQVRTPYTQNSRSMMLYEYRSVFFVCQKPYNME